jgi:hypothetical protein
MAAWRLFFTFNRRPERTVADEEGGSGRPSTILDGSRRKTAMDALPGAASELPCCRIDEQQQDPFLGCFIKSTRFMNKQIILDIEFFK